MSHLLWLIPLLLVTLATWHDLRFRDADVMLNSGKEMAVVFQSLEISEATYHRWRAQYGGMKSDEAKRLKELEVGNSRLKRLLADAELSRSSDISTLPGGQFLNHAMSQNVQELPAVRRLQTG